VFDKKAHTFLSTKSEQYVTNVTVGSSQHGHAKLALRKKIICIRLTCKY